MTDDNAVQKVKEVMGDKLFEEIRDYFVKGHLGLAELMQIPHNELENLHQLGRLHISKEEYTTAEKILKMLVHLHPNSASFWGTYGMALYHQENWPFARIAYATAQELDLSNMEYIVRGAECELMMNNPKYALDTIKPAFHMKAPDGNKGVELLKMAQRIKMLAENMEPGQDDMDAITRRIQADQA